MSEGTDYSALGIGLGNTIYNAVQAGKNRDFQANQNFMDRQQQEKMYRWTRDDAREDWATNNAYNSPIEQMNRLRQAGLSPHLVYGKGADNTASAIRSYSGEALNQPAPQLDWKNISNNLMTGFDIKLRQAQTDNVNADTDLKVKDMLVKDASIASSLASTAKTKFELEQAERVKEAVVDKVVLGNIKTETDIQYTLDQNERQKLANSTNVQKTMQEIVNLKIRAKQEKVQTQKTQQEIENLKLQQKVLQNEGIIKQAEAELNKKGMQKNDPWYARALMEMAIDIYNALH